MKRSSWTVWIVTVLILLFAFSQLSIGLHLFSEDIAIISLLGFICLLIAFVIVLVHLRQKKH